MRKKRMRPIGRAQLGKWFEALSAGLVLYARQWLEAESAEDVVQDVFVRLISLRKPPKNPRTWLFRCVRNAATSRLRRRRRRRRHHERIAASAPVMFHTDPGVPIDADAAQRALAALPRDLQEVVVLRIWGQMKLREIAEITGRPISTLMSQYQSAIEKIRQQMVQPCKNTKS